jgi:hypothetical protein
MRRTVAGEGYWPFAAGAGELVTLEGAVADVRAFHPYSVASTVNTIPDGSCDPCGTPVRNSRPQELQADASGLVGIFWA